MSGFRSATGEQPAETMIEWSASKEKALMEKLTEAYEKHSRGGYTYVKQKDRVMKIVIRS